ncbi:hypothetical protein ANCDUO_15177 [Ancylostoma duodenale]|uniref:Uncharacterized protein n=1 Tax=Ancylostoma duodenale TaxID=51022 RepID=A0A0C2G152_9BILA|nr:hypothetical protein ANCDUO_15177 [Ancylostoma duodenale]
MTACALHQCYCSRKTTDQCLEREDSVLALECIQCDKNAAWYSEEEHERHIELCQNGLVPPTPCKNQSHTHCIVSWYRSGGSKETAYVQTLHVDFMRAFRSSKIPVNHPEAKNPGPRLLPVTAPPGHSIRPGKACPTLPTDDDAVWVFEVICQRSAFCLSSPAEPLMESCRSPGSRRLAVDATRTFSNHS